MYLPDVFIVLISASIYVYIIYTHTHFISSPPHVFLSQTGSYVVSSSSKASLKVKVTTNSVLLDIDCILYSLSHLSHHDAPDH